MRLSPKDRALLASWGIHIVIVVMLLRFFNPAARWGGSAPVPRPQAGLAAPERVWLPPKEALRQVLPPRPKPAAVPAPAAPQPPQVRQKDRISIGPPSTERARELLLRREDDLTKTPHGERGTGAEPNRPQDAAPGAERAAAAGGPSPQPPSTGLDGRLVPPIDGRSRAGAGANPGLSIMDSARRWEDRLARSGAAGIPSGTGRQMGPLFFDPAGADFTAWVNHFKNEVYRNWIVPQSVLMGLHGRVDIEFTVNRDGQLAAMRLVRSAGTGALDRAAENALTGSHLLPLPNDFAPSAVTMLVTFFYNEGPTAP